MLAEYQAILEAIAADQLGPYTARVIANHEAHNAVAKELNDPVWGTLTLSPLEVLLLDSPLFQRLRRVRQLGVAQWVYPAATHSRLEHSIGALHQAQRLIGAANSRVEAVPTKYQSALRVAALCHDIGHGVMSHVSENALAYIEETEDLRNEFAEVHKEEAQLGEINSFFLIGSPAFAELLKAAERASGEMLGLPDAPSFLQKCIIGKSIDPEYPLLHQLVSGPFDADKLDYMTRDAYMSGVPVVTDVNRLIRKVRSIQLPRMEVPDTVQHLSDVNTPMVTVLGIDRSGNRTLDELTLGRTLLFDKLYRHQKIRACEAMVTAMLVRISRSAVHAGERPEAAAVVLRLDDDALTTGEVTKYLQGYPLDDESAQVVSHLAQWLRERRLFVRAIAFSRKMTNDPYDQDDEQGRALQELLAHIEDPINRREVGKRIATLTIDALRILESESAIDGWPGTLEDYIWVDGLRGAEHLTAPTKAMLITAEGEVVPFSAEAPETPQWATAYQQTRDTAFVYCPPEIALAAGLAAERYLREHFRVRLPKGALIAARRLSENARSQRKALKEGGFYDDSPLDLLPLPEPLWRGDADLHLEHIASRLHGYCPPLVEPDRAGRDRFASGRIKDFVSQFESDDLIASALTILGKVEMIDRHSVVRPLLKLLDETPEFRDASLVVFGSPADSSSIATYYALDAAGRYPDLQPRELGAALLVDKPILFVDDLIGSGRQSASIVRAWFGDLSLAKEMGEKREVLPPEARELLQQRPVSFCFAAGLEGRSELAAALEECGIPVTRITVGREESTLPTIFESGDLKTEARRKFIDRCKQIGDELLESQADERREKRLLGYGNKGLLITFPYNTPSQTLTCIWERGYVDGKPWTPLLPRRRKK